MSAPAKAEKIPPANRYHLIRALELATANSLTPDFSPAKGRRKYATLLLGLNPPREELYAKINARADQMMRSGLLMEVKKLAEKYERSAPALRGHGYRELLDHLAGEKTLEQAVAEVKQDTRHYAKRQITWWRNSELSKEIYWINPTAVL